MLKITVLGSGTSQGVPVIACTCDVCLSIDPRDNRLRSSIMIEKNGTTIVVDAGPDFRQQMLRAKVSELNAILITHTHKDHIAGLDDVRSFNYLLKKPMKVYASPDDQLAIKQEFSYAFSDDPYPGVPEIELVDLDLRPFNIGPVNIIPIEVMHMHMKVFGFRFGNFAYITDANFISEEGMQMLQGVKVLMIVALRIKKHKSHFNLDEAIEVAKKLNAEQTYFTHVSHMMGRVCDIEAQLPENMMFAYDGLSFELHE